MDSVEIGNIKIPAVRGKEGKAGIIKEISLKELDVLESPYIKNLGTENEAILEIGIPKNDTIVSTKVDENGEAFLIFESGKEVSAGYDELIVQQIDEILNIVNLKKEEIGTIAQNYIGDLNNLYNDCIENLENLQNNVNTSKEEYTQIVEKNISDLETSYNSYITTIENTASTATENITTKIEEFNNNATSETTEFDTNASNELDAFNTNASQKTTAFDNNYTQKLAEFNANAEDFERKHNYYTMTVTEEIEAETEVEIPCNYIVGENNMDIFCEGEYLKCEKSEDDLANWREVGVPGAISNKVQFGWNLEVGDTFTFIVKGANEDEQN